MPKAWCALLKIRHQNNKDNLISARDRNVSHKPTGRSKGNYPLLQRKSGRKAS